MLPFAADFRRLILAFHKSIAVWRFLALPKCEALEFRSSGARENISEAGRVKQPPRASLAQIHLSLVQDWKFRPTRVGMIAFSAFLVINVRTHEFPTFMSADFFDVSCVPDARNQFSRTVQQRTHCRGRTPNPCGITSRDAPAAGV